MRYFRFLPILALIAFNLVSCATAPKQEPSVSAPDREGSEWEEGTAAPQEQQESAAAPQQEQGAQMREGEAPAAEPPPAPEEKPAAQTGVRTCKVWLWQETRDCLWNIAKKYYGDPWLWKKIYLANRHQIEDPRVIYPKQVLIIPPLDDNER